MRFKWDEVKSQRLKRLRGFGFGEVKGVFALPYYESQKNDDPTQHRAIGWCKGSLISVIFEERYDDMGLYYWLVTYWRATFTERKLYEES